MAYISNLHQKNYTIEPGEKSQQREITINGKSQKIDWQQIAPLTANEKGQRTQGGRYSLLIGTQSYEVFARRLELPDETGGLTYEIQIAGQRFEVHVEDERIQKLSSSLKTIRDTDEVKVRAPMPGLVLNVVKAVGESVERGETVVVLEAMKMENDLASPHAGVVKEVRVSQGQTVSQGDILVVIAGA
jgi:biotin carboxyl carrier protein